MPVDCFDVLSFEGFWLPTLMSACGPIADITEDGSDVCFRGQCGHALGPAECRQMTHLRPTRCPSLCSGWGEAAMRLHRYRMNECGRFRWESQEHRHCGCNPNILPTQGTGILWTVEGGAIVGSVSPGPSADKMRCFLLSKTPRRVPVNPAGQS
jgi:hypothetical protein